MYFILPVTGGWAGWAIAHPVFGRIEGAALLLAHPALGSQLRPCNYCQHPQFQNPTLGPKLSFASPKYSGPEIAHHLNLSLIENQSQRVGRLTTKKLDNSMKFAFISNKKYHSKVTIYLI